MCCAGGGYQSGSINFENPNGTEYLLVVSARPDGIELSQTIANVTIRVLNVNEGPVFVGNFSRELLENATVGIAGAFGEAIQGDG